MTKENYQSTIAGGEAILGLELGSTRIKAVLIGKDHTPIAGGSAAWENSLVDGIWTYSLDEVWAGCRAAYADLKADVAKRYGIKLTNLAAMGISGMMHGYLPFDRDGKQLAAFRTWRNTITEQAAGVLSELFDFNIPQRWSIAHLHQAILNGEAHVPAIRYLTTVAGYLHWQLTGKFVLGAGEASGMFPLDGRAAAYHPGMLQKYNDLIAPYGFDWQLEDILPTVLSAGEDAGSLTAAGAALLDPAGDLQPGIPFAPPEGDAGTGMAATNSVTPYTGNVSAGTSIFSMVVLDGALKGHYPEIDVAATPAGKPVAMVHCNNCTSDINAWASLLMEFSAAVGHEIGFGEAIEAMFRAAMGADADCGGVLAYNFFSGEHIVGLEEGRPMLLRGENAAFSFANFARAGLYSAMATLRIGMDILSEKEAVRIDSLLGHGGFFKSGDVGQRLMASALGSPISVMATAGEGGPWGMALLAAYRVHGAGMTLEDYLGKVVFSTAEAATIGPDAATAAGFDRYLARYKAALPAEKAAIATLRS